MAKIKSYKIVLVTAFDGTETAWGHARDAFPFTSDRQAEALARRIAPEAEHVRVLKILSSAEWTRNEV